MTLELTNLMKYKYLDIGQDKQSYWMAGGKPYKNNCSAGSRP